MSSTISSSSIDIILGTVAVVVSLPSLCFYLQILKIFYTQKTRFGTHAYQLMFQLGIFDCLQLLFHMFGGIFSIANTTFDDIFNKICGGILNSAWIVSILFTLLLAFNRFSTLCFRHKTAFFENSILFKTQILISWLYFGTFLIIYLTSYCSVIYIPSNFAWEYDSSDWSPIIAKIEFYATLFELGFTGILYLYIIFWLMTTKQQVQTTNSREYKQEFKILVQAIVISGYTGFCLVMWHTYSNFLPDSRYSTFACNLIWIINGSINPFLYILMNKSVRQALMDKFNSFKDGKHTVSIRESRTAMKSVTTVTPIVF